MYNDEKNLYHYTYRKDGSEGSEAEARPSVDDQLRAFQSQNQNGPQQPIQEMKPVKKNRVGMKLTALALCCALLGGAVGGGIVWGVSNSGEEDSTTINVSDRTVSHMKDACEDIVACEQMPLTSADLAMLTPKPAAVFGVTDEHLAQLCAKYL